MNRSRIVIAVAVTAGMFSVGAATAYAVAAKTPTLSSVCVSTLSSHALTAPTAGKCPKRTTLKKLPGGATGAVGPTGPAGPAGPAGPSGPTGAPGATSVVTESNTQTVGPNTDFSFSAVCPATTKLTGGGVNGASTAVRVIGSYPNAQAAAWVGRFYNTGATTVSVSVFALCAAP